MKGAYTIGIEEEYFLVDAATKTVTEERPEAFFAAVKAALGSQVSGEMLQSQIEVMTEPHHDMATARAELKREWLSMIDGAVELLAVGQPSGVMHGYGFSGDRGGSCPGCNLPVLKTGNGGGRFSGNLGRRCVALGVARCHDGRS